MKVFIILKCVGKGFAIC